MENKVIGFWGNCEIKTNLHLEELAINVSRVLCGGLPFTFGKHSIWEEIPSMYIENSIIGMLIIVGGYGGDKGYSVAINPFGDFSRYVYANNLTDKEAKIKLDFHLYHLLKAGLFNHPEIEIIEPQTIA